MPEIKWQSSINPAYLEEALVGDYKLVLFRKPGALPENRYMWMIYEGSFEWTKSHGSRPTIEDAKAEAEAALTRICN